MDDIHAQHRTHGNPSSTAKIGDHPIHPMLVPFPNRVLCRRVRHGYRLHGERQFRLGYGIDAASRSRGRHGVARGDPLVRGHSDAVKHVIANISAVALEAINLVLRLGNPDAIRSTGIYLSGLVVPILLYSGWKGGEPVFRHGVGVIGKHSR